MASGGRELDLALVEKAFAKAKMLRKARQARQLWNILVSESKMYSEILFRGLARRNNYVMYDAF